MKQPTPSRIDHGRQLILALALAIATAATAFSDNAIVDEPLGARYSLGMTLWHLGHNAEMITRFHDYVRDAGQSPQTLLSKQQLQPPATMQRILLDPELLDKAQLNGWKVDGDYVTSWAGDAGPAFTLPMRIPRTGTYRLWTRFIRSAGRTGVTYIKIYRDGEESRGPVVQLDEVYADPKPESGPSWDDMLVALPAGDYTIKMGHVTRWWHGGEGHDVRKIDCLYLTNEIWRDPPSDAELAALRASAESAGVQWTASPALPAEDRESWRWWQVRPLSWENAAANPELFALSRMFHKKIIDELAQKKYSESAVPDYRAPERQVVFNETWNMVANPVRAQRQINVLRDDVSTEPVQYNWAWRQIAPSVKGN